MDPEGNPQNRVVGTRYTPFRSCLCAGRQQCLFQRYIQGLGLKGWVAQKGLVTVLQCGYKVNKLLSQTLRCSTFLVALIRTLTKTKKNIPNSTRNYIGGSRLSFFDGNSALQPHNFGFEVGGFELIFLVRRSGLWGLWV